MQDICSILKATSYEERMMARLWDGVFPQDYPDKVAEAMTAHLNAGKNIFWENLFAMDVTTRVLEKVHGDNAPPQTENAPPPPHDAPPPPTDMLRELKEMMMAGLNRTWRMIEQIDEKVSIIDEKVSIIDGRVKLVEGDVKVIRASNKGKEKVVDDMDYEVGCEANAIFEDYLGDMGEGSNVRRNEVDCEATGGEALGDDAADGDDVAADDAAAGAVDDADDAAADATDDAAGADAADDAASAADDAASAADDAAGATDDAAGDNAADYAVGGERAGGEAAAEQPEEVLDEVLEDAREDQPSPMLQIVPYDQPVPLRSEPPHFRPPVPLRSEPPDFTPPVQKRQRFKQTSRKRVRKPSKFKKSPFN